MNILRKLMVFLFIIFCTNTNAQTPMAFFHPDGVTGQEELDFVKSKILVKEQPWYGFYKQKKSWAKGGTNAIKFINSND